MRSAKIIAHRGNFSPEGPIPEVMDKYEIPENTLWAFERAFQNGWGIEIDIRVAGDGNFVVIHDRDIVRFSGESGAIDQMAVPEIQKVKHKTNSRFGIPTLDSLFELAKKYTRNGKSPFVAFQIKRGSNPDNGLRVGRAVAERMGQYRMEDSIIFDPIFEEAQILRSEFPKLNLSVSVGEKNYSPTIYTPEQVLTPEFAKVFNCVWADEWKELGSIYNKEMFARLRAAFGGRIDVISPELHYNENHPLSRDIEGLKRLWRKIVSWGTADGICTDYPSKLSFTLETVSGVLPTTPTQVNKLFLDNN